MLANHRRRFTGVRQFRSILRFIVSTVMWPTTSLRHTSASVASSPGLWRRVSIRPSRPKLSTSRPSVRKVSRNNVA